MCQAGFLSNLIGVLLFGIRAGLDTIYHTYTRRRAVILGIAICLFLSLRDRGSGSCVTSPLPWGMSRNEMELGSLEGHDGTRGIEGGGTSQLGAIAVVPEV